MCTLSGVAPYAKPRYSERFRLNAFFVGLICAGL